jgi:hypothetical protein
MHLLAPLAAGMAGAASGTVEVYARGTTNPITLYTDFEGTVTTANPATLDANGRAKLYVDQYARCVVKTPGGTTVIDFVDGYDANGVELRSASIIGNAYVGGAAAAGNPISVEAAINKLITSFGSTDFNVLLAGVSTTMQAALGALWRARVFDVKVYGALGDGATNDLAAINAAASAANTAGGGIVFFPPGTYQISAALTMFSTIEYVGAGAALSVVRAASDFVVFTGATMPLAVRKLGLAKSAAMTTWVLSSGSGAVVFEDCSFASTTAGGTSSSAFTNSGTGKVTLARCSMTAANGAGRLWTVSSSGEIVVDGCSATSGVSGGSLGSVSFSGGSSGVLARLTLLNTLDDNSNVGSGGVTCNGISVGSYGALVATGCRFRPETASTSTQAAISADSDTECYVYESGNDFSEHYALLPTNVAQGPYRVAGTGASAKRFYGTRELASMSANNQNGSPIVLHLTQARFAKIQTTAGAGTRLIDAGGSGGTGPGEGTKGTLAVHNDTGSSITYQWSTGFASTGTTFAVAANSVRTFELVYILERSEWYIVSDIAGAETAE